MALLVVGAVMLMPPVAGIFLLDGRVLGIPLPLLYVLVVWAFLIAGTALLAYRLRDGDGSVQAAERPEGDG